MITHFDTGTTFERTWMEKTHHTNEPINLLNDTINENGDADM